MVLILPVKGDYPMAFPILSLEASGCHARLGVVIGGGSCSLEVWTWTCIVLYSHVCPGGPGAGSSAHLDKVRGDIILRSEGPERGSSHLSSRRAATTDSLPEVGDPKSSSLSDQRVTLR